MGYADAVEREAAWLAIEPLAGFTPLLVAGQNGGVLDYIGARPKRLAQHPRQLHVYREHFVETRIDTAHKSWEHRMLLALFWPMNNPERADTEQAALDEALDRILERIRDSLGEHTHGGRFWSVGEDGGLASRGGAIEVRMPDWRVVTSPVDQPLAPGKSYVVEIRYPAIEIIEV